MNHRMEQEMARTIRVLRASMPVKKQNSSTGALLRLAAEEMRGPLPLALLAAAILLGMGAVRLLSSPMLTAFCTAPIPALLLFHRYVLRGNERMRELEGTFLYSYTEMLVGRTIMISIYMLGALFCLSLALHQMGGEDFLRLALCGAVPSIYLCAILLFLGRMAKPGTALIAVTLWAALAFFVVPLPVEQLLCQCPTIAYGAAAGAGLVFYAVNIHKMKTRRDFYAPSLG